MMNRLIAPLARAVAHHPGRVVLCWLVAVLLSGLACLRLTPGARLSDMLGDSSPEATAFNHVLDHYALADELLIVVTDKPGFTAKPEDLRQSAQDLADALTNEAPLKTIGAELRPAPAQAVRKFIEQVAIRRAVSYLPPESLKRLHERLTEPEMRQRFALLKARLNAPGAAGEIGKQMAKDPLDLRDFLPEAFPAMKGASGKPEDWMAAAKPAAKETTLIEFSPDGRAALLRLAGREGATVMPYAESIVAGTEHALAPLKEKLAARGLRAELAGPYALATTSARTAKHDFTWSTFETIGLILLMYFIIYRRPQGLHLLVACTFVPLAVGFGIYALTCGRITPLTAVAGAILAGLGIDYAIQTLHHHQRLRAEGFDDATAAERTTIEQWMPLLGACVSACVGFGAIAITRTPAMKQLAWLSGLCLATSCLAALTLLPAAMVLIGRWRKSKGKLNPSEAAMAPRWNFGKLSCFLATRPRLSFGIFTCACVLAVAGSVMGYLRPAQGAGLYALHPEPNPALEAQAHMAEHFGKSEGMVLAWVKAEQTENLLATCAKVREVSQAEGFKAMGAADLLPAVPREARPPVSGGAAPPETGGPSAGQLAEARLLAAAKAEGFNPKAFAGYAAFIKDNLSLPPPTFADLPPQVAAMVLPKGVDIAHPTETLVLLTPNHVWKDADDRDAHIGHLRLSMAQVPGVTLTGPDALSVVMRAQVREDLPLALLVAAIGVFLWHALTCRKLLDTTLSLVPSLFGLAAAASCAWICRIEWNAITLAALPLIMGTGVDGNLFLVLFARDHAKTGNRNTLEELDKGTIAMLMIALTTLAGFGTLILGSTPAVRDLGLLTSVGVVGAVFTSFTCVMPALWWAEKKMKA